MDNIINMRVSKAKEDIGRALREIEQTATEALDAAARIVRFKVMDLTPRWMGGLVKAVKSEARGREGRVYGEGVVMRVMENNAQWTKVPPHQPVKAWVEGKLGITGKQGDSVAWAIQQKIKKSGMTLPNKEGRGQMFARTFQLMESTRFHWQAFISRMKQLENRNV